MSRRATVAAVIIFVLMAVGLGGFLAASVDEARQSRLLAENNAERAQAELVAEQSRSMAEAERLADQIDRLTVAVNRLGSANATLAEDVDRLVGLTVDQSSELDNLRARVAQLSAAIIELGGQIPSARSQSQPEPECEGPPGQCRDEGRNSR